MDPDFNYEPTAEESVLARATAAGQSAAEYGYDLLMKDEGKGFIYFPILNYRDGNLELPRRPSGRRRHGQFPVRWRRTLRDNLRCRLAHLHAPALGSGP